MTHYTNEASPQTDEHVPLGGTKHEQNLTHLHQLLDFKTSRGSSVLRALLGIGCRLETRMGRRPESCATAHWSHPPAKHSPSHLYTFGDTNRALRRRVSLS